MRECLSKRLVNRQVIRVDQPQTSIATRRRGIDDEISNSNLFFAGSFNKTTVPAILTSFRRNISSEGSFLLCKENDVTPIAGAIAAKSAIGTYFTCTVDIVATDFNRTARRTGSIQLTGHLNVGAAPGEDDFAPFTGQARRFDNAGIVDRGINDVTGSRSGHQDLPAIHNNRAVVFCFQLARIFSCATLNSKADQAVTINVDRKSIGRGQLNFGQVPLDNPVIAHRRRNQCDQSGLFDSNRTFVHDRGVCFTGFVEIERRRGHELVVINVRRGGHETSRVNVTIRANNDAVRVDKDNLSVGNQVPVQVTDLAICCDAVKGNRRGRRLNKTRRLT